jgi:hypothetical protein
MTQWMLILDLFHSHGNVLTTADFGHHPTLWAEYRRALCDLKKRGYRYEVKPIKRNLFEYRLIESQPDLLRVA